MLRRQKCVAISLVLNYQPLVLARSIFIRAKKAGAKAQFYCVRYLKGETSVAARICSEAFRRNEFLIRCLL
jgi:hypothetical protein